MNKAETEAYLLKNDFYTWMIKRAILPEGAKYSFKDYEYLIDICKRVWKKRDQVYVEKPSQVGISEIAIDWFLWLAERKLPNFKGMGYIFPAKKQFDAHIKARIAPILSHKDFCGNLGLSNLEYTVYNKIPWYFRCGHSRDLKSFRADAIAVDEFDEYENPISIIPTVEARFKASPYKWILGLSTPTYPDMGIDLAIKQCTQHHWFVSCDICHKKFSPLVECITSGFEDTVVLAPITKKVGFVCPNCKELTNTCGAPGGWEITSTLDNQKYSYSVSGLFVKQVTLKELYTKYEAGLNLPEFFNSELGLPYSPANSRLKRSDIEAMAIGPMDLKKVYAHPTWAGIDVGNVCHYIIGTKNEDNKNHIINYGTCKFEELPNILKAMNTKCMVIDLRPEEVSAKNIIRGHKHFYACDFNVGKQIDWYTKILADGETSDQKVRILKASRTQSCDKLIMQIISKKQYVYPSSVKSDNDFMNQMCSVQRVEKENKETKEKTSFYTSTSTKDHYFFAHAYLNIAFNLKHGSGIAKLAGLFF